MKFLLLPLAGALPELGQAFVLLCMPVIIGIVLFAISSTNRPEESTSLRINDPFRIKMLLGILILLPIMNAVIRTFNSLGAWGGAGIVTLVDFPEACLTAVILAIVTYCVFAHCNETQPLSVIIRALFVLILGFLVVQSSLLHNMGFPEMLIGSFEDFIETFSGALFWLSLIVTARILPLHPARVVGVGQAVRNVAAIALGVMLQVVPSAGKTIILVVMSALVLGFLLLFDRLAKTPRAIGSPSTELDEACSLAAQRHDLTVRETEVLVMLGQGRSQSYIADKLVVAPSTVKTHVRHIYKKLGVSTKQELISLLRDEQ